MRDFRKALATFFELLPELQQTRQLPAELSNLDQLKVLLDALPDYHQDDEQPSYVLAVPCRPVLAGLRAVLAGLLVLPP